METQFLQLPIKLLDIEESNKFMCILTYAIIDNQKTYDKTSCISFDKMIVKYGIDKKTTRKAVQTLRDYSLLDWEQVDTGRTNGNGKKEVFNRYTFPLIKARTKDIVINGKNYGKKELESTMRVPFKMLSTDILTIDLTTKEKGVLLALHLLSDENDNILLNKKEIAEKLGITPKTLKKHLDLLIERELLFVKKDYFTFNKPTITKENLTIIL